MQSPCTTELDVLKTLTNLMFCVLKQLSQFQLLFVEMKKQMDQNAEQSIRTFKQEIKALDDDIKRDEIHKSIDQIRAHIENMEIHKIPSIIDQIENQNHKFMASLEESLIIKPRDYEPDIFKACKKGNLSSVRYLIERSKVQKNIKNKNGNQLIHNAAFYGHLDIVKYLIEEQDIDINCKGNNEYAPLHCAAVSGRLDVLEYLISKGADLNSRDHNGNTPLHSATLMKNLKNQYEIVESLVKHGADKYLTNNEDQKPRDYASNTKIQYLLK